MAAVKRWNGSGWAPAKLKTFGGSGWSERAKIWNGSEWDLVGKREVAFGAIGSPFSVDGLSRQLVANSVHEAPGPRCAAIVWAVARGSGRDGFAITATYGGQPMSGTSVTVSSNASSTGVGFQFRLYDPPTGPQPVVVTLSSAGAGSRSMGLRGNVVSYANVKDFGLPVSISGHDGGDILEHTIPSTPGNMVAHALFIGTQGDGPVAIVPGSYSQTERWLDATDLPDILIGDAPGAPSATFRVGRRPWRAWASLGVDLIAG